MINTPGLTVTTGPEQPAETYEAPEPEPRKFAGPNEAYLAWYIDRVSAHDAWWGLSTEQRNLAYINTKLIPRNLSGFKPEWLCSIWNEQLCDNVQIWVTTQQAIRLALFTNDCIKAVRVRSSVELESPFTMNVESRGAGPRGEIAVFGREVRQLLLKQHGPVPLLRSNYDTDRDAWIVPGTTAMTCDASGTRR